MLVSEAKERARQWVADEGNKLPGFMGAYLTGSTTWLAEGGELPAASDVDVHIALDASEAPLKLGKFVYRDVLLEVSFTTVDRLGSAEEILANHQVAGAFRTPNVIADPSGRLTELQAAVSSDFANRDWVQKRCESASNHVRRYASAMNESLPHHEQATIWAFAVGCMTHVLLVAGLKNPTVRKRYLAVRELLAQYDRLDFYDTLLEPLGCAGLSADQVERHLPALEAAFDAAARALTTPLFFASDISADARHIAIDGSRELIARGDHREAVFWLVATYARCQKVLTDDAPTEHATHQAGFDDLLRDLGITSFGDFEEHVAQVEALLPSVSEVAADIMTANPEIEDQLAGRSSVHE